MATLVDLQPLMIVSYITIPKAERTYDKFRNNFFDRLFNGVLGFVKQFGPLILCAEGGASWRKAFYPEYKAHRHNKPKSKEEQADKDQMFEWFESLIKEIQENKVFRLIRVDSAEADDIIATLSYSATQPTLIISSDKDFQQCQINENVRQWSAAKKDFLKCENPKEFLIEHIVRGDSTDNIPSIRKELYKKGVERDKTRLAITKKWLADFKAGVDFEKYEKRYNENKKLIDLTEIPVDIKERILEEINKEWKKDTTRAIAYFKDNGMGKFAEEYILK